MPSSSLELAFTEPFEDRDTQPVDGDGSRVTRIPEARIEVRDTWVDGEAPGSPRAVARERLGETIAGRWKLIGVLGAGAGGAVYEAFDRHEGRLAAVKVLHDGLRSSQEHVARFHAEAQLASQIGHPGIVRVLASGTDDDGSIYQVLELLDGEPLAQMIDRGGLSDEEILGIGRQLLEALKAAHDCRIIHRDVKPENVFLARDDEGALHVKLLDFGIAKHLAPEHGSVRTQNGITLGTPHYMSPEQCLGEKLDPRTDLWSAGAVLFHAFTGGPPYRDPDPARVIVRVVEEEPPSLAELRPDLPTSVIDVVDRALSRTLAHRFQSADEMNDALELSSLDVSGTFDL